MDQQPIVQVNDVAMRFNLASEKVDNFKEYFIRRLKHGRGISELSFHKLL